MKGGPRIWSVCVSAYDPLNHAQRYEAREKHINNPRRMRFQGRRDLLLKRLCGAFLLEIFIPLM